MALPLLLPLIMDLIPHNQGKGKSLFLHTALPCRPAHRCHSQPVRPAQRYQLGPGCERETGEWEVEVKEGREGTKNTTLFRRTELWFTAEQDRRMKPFKVEFDLHACTH